MVATEKLEKQQLRKMKGLNSRGSPSRYEISGAFYELNSSCCKKEFNQTPTSYQIKT